MKQIIRSIALFFLSFILFFSFFASQGFAERPALKYVALGNSLAAGFLNSQEIGDGYPVYIAQGIEEETLYQVDLINYGVGGFTTVHLLEQIQRADVQQDLSEADFITIDIGANDILWEIGTDFDLTDPEELQRIVQAVSEAMIAIQTNVGEILTQIQQLNPDAPIFFMGYYNALPYLEGQDAIQLMIATFNNTLQNASEKHGAIFVPTYDAFVGKYDMYMPNPNDIHPTKEGYEAIASLFLEKIMPILPPIHSIPEIALHGENPLYLKVGDTYVEPGASAFDSIDGDLTDQIEMIGDVNTNEAGVYTIVYQVANRLGETASAERIIHVEEIDDSVNPPPSKLKPEKPKPQADENRHVHAKKVKKESAAAASATLSGGKLPKTAAVYPIYLFIGLITVIAGMLMLFLRMNIVAIRKNRRLV